MSVQGICNGIGRRDKGPVEDLYSGETDEKQAEYSRVPHIAAGVYI